MVRTGWLGERTCAVGTPPASWKQPNHPRNPRFPSQHLVLQYRTIATSITSGPVAKPHAICWSARDSVLPTCGSFSFRCLLWGESYASRWRSVLCKYGPTPTSDGCFVQYDRLRLSHGCPDYLSSYLSSYLSRKYSSHGKV